MPCAAWIWIFLADRDVFDVPTELTTDDLRRIGVERAVDVHSGHAELEQLAQDVRGLHAHAAGEIGDGHALSQRDRSGDGRRRRR